MSRVVTARVGRNDGPFRCSFLLEGDPKDGVVRVAAVVQARMNSRRFPGKVLHKVRGRPLLGCLLDRLRVSREIDNIIVATSVDATDTPIAAYCSERGVDCFRGSLDDVAGRFRGVSDVYDLDAFVRVCGDSPLLDPAVVDRGVSSFREAEVDVVTNCFPRTFPGGQSVEVVRAATFRHACTRMTDSTHFEHVTTFLYEHPDEYRIHNFTNPAGNQSDLDLSVNTPGEMAIFERLHEPGEDALDLPRIVQRYRAVAV